MLEISSGNLMVDESAARLPDNLAALAKDVRLDAEARDVDADSAELCEVLGLEPVPMREEDAATFDRG